MKYRKKPVIIEAELTREIIEKCKNEWNELPLWFTNAYSKGDVLILGRDGIEIRTLEGTMHAEPDDYIICGVQGELYPCKPDIFALTYEKIERIEGNGKDM